MDKGTAIIQIVGAVIASGLLLSAISNIYGFFYQPKPFINIMPDNKDEHLTYINVKNNGQKPITNLLLTIEAPSIIKNSSIFHTENITITNFSKLNPKALQIYLPRLAHGDGSFIEIKTFINTILNKSRSNYNVYATFDQGSIKEQIRESLSPEAQFFSFISTYWILFLLIIGLIIALIVIWRAKQIKNRYLNAVKAAEERVIEAKEKYEETKEESEQA